MLAAGCWRFAGVTRVSCWGANIGDVLHENSSNGRRTATTSRLAACDGSRACGFSSLRRDALAIPDRPRRSHAACGRLDREQHCRGTGAWLSPPSVPLPFCGAGLSQRTRNTNRAVHQLQVLPPEAAATLLRVVSETGRMLTVMRRKTRERLHASPRTPPGTDPRSSI
jgi:hypothetical protein